MKAFPKRNILILTGLLTISLNASPQFVTLARKIKSKLTQTSAVSTLSIDAKPNKVYHAIVDTVNSSMKLKLLNGNEQKRQVEIQSGTSNIKMVVDSLGINLSKITVSATDQEQPSEKTTELSVNAILAVCKKLGIHYQ